jgi:hypothetical protein
LRIFCQPVAVSPKFSAAAEDSPSLPLNLLLRRSGKPLHFALRRLVTLA